MVYHKQNPCRNDKGKKVCYQHIENMSISFEKINKLNFYNHHNPKPWSCQRLIAIKKTPLEAKPRVFKERRFQSLKGKSRIIRIA